MHSISLSLGVVYIMSYCFAAFRSVFARGSVAFLLAAATITLPACDLATNYTKPDRGADMQMQDFRDGLSERLPDVDGGEGGKDGKSSLAAIPELQPYVSSSTVTAEPMPLVSVSVNQSVPIRDVLFELAEQASYDLELDPNIRGSIIFTARNKPFDQVVERICGISGLRYKFEDSFLRVELDSPYNKIYKIDFLSFIRSSGGSVGTNVSVVSGDGADTGSTYSSSTSSEADFWSELDANLKQILGGASSGILTTSKDPRISAVEQNPDVQAVAPAPTIKEGDSSSDGESKSEDNKDNKPSATVEVKPPEAVLKVESLPVDAAEEKSKGKESDNPFTYTINKQAGIINVYAPERIQKLIDNYLKILKKSVSAQVLVEAKVFEVSLTDEYINGIDWQALKFPSAEGITGFLTAESILAETIGGITVPDGDVANLANFSIGYAGNDVQAFVQAISGFGTVRALASPRLTVLNNQSAVLNVATNRVFFEVDLSRETDDDTGDVTLEVETDIKSVPEGVLINVQPSINLDNNTISMVVRPTVTRIVRSVQDPSVQFVAGDSGIVSEIPEVNIQEIDTVVQVRSGQPIVMGGLLQDNANATQNGVPVLGEIPVLGSAFRRQKDNLKKTELVIFLKATVVNAPGDTIHDTDRDLYKTFSGDRRPLKL